MQTIIFNTILTSTPAITVTDFSEECFQERDPGFELPYDTCPHNVGQATLTDHECEMYLKASKLYREGLSAQEAIAAIWRS